MILADHFGIPIPRYDDVDSITIASVVSDTACHRPRASASLLLRKSDQAKWNDSLRKITTQMRTETVGPLQQLTFDRSLHIERSRRFITN